VKAILLLLLLAAALPLAAQLPDAPAPQPKATFWTFRGHWQAPPLRSSREVLTGKKFIALHVALMATFLIDHRLTRGERETYGSEVPAILAVTGVDYLSDRVFTEAFTVEAPIYGIQHYARDAAHGQTYSGGLR
jgi:hypothetical protein